MDIATIIGLILGMIVIAAPIALGSAPMAFVDVPSMCVVLGGTICSVLIHFSMPQFLAIFAIIKKTIVVKISSPLELTQQMVNFAAVNRRDGALALEEQLRSIKDQFVTKGLQMLVDGQEEDAIRDMMSLEIQYIHERHSEGKKILEFMGASAPAFGMIGTLIGLVMMLQNLSDPSSIGTGMAIALLTTFYGAVLANVVFIPLGGKLGIYSKKEIISMEMTMEGICSISRGENPTVVREKMQSFVSPSKREDVKATV